MIVRAIALLLCGTSALPAAAQDRAAADPSATQDIVVIGRGLPARPGDRTADVVAIDAARIRESASGRLETVLADVAGLQQFRRSDSRSANPTSQGLSLRGIGEGHLSSVTLRTRSAAGCPSPLMPPIASA